VSRLLKGISGTLRRVAGRRRTPTPPAPAQVPTVFRGRHLEYSPNLDGDADPGEIVWTWVEYEDDPSQGKDRPVLVVGRTGRTLLGLMLSSHSERNGRSEEHRRELQSPTLIPYAVFCFKKRTVA
jgi:hypothetical protein